MTDTALNIALAALRTIAGCGLDAAACVRTAQIAIEAVEGMEAERQATEAKRLADLEKTMRQEMWEIEKATIQASARANLTVPNPF